MFSFWLVANTWKVLSALWMPSGAIAVQLGLLRVIMVSPPFMFSTPACSVSLSASGGAWQSPGHSTIFTGLPGGASTLLM
ncbi:hypothetical protein D3C86_1277290 [compost metagenome]